jgi:predicted transglutaminase-like cysteine proteinase
MGVVVVTPIKALARGAFILSLSLPAAAHAGMPQASAPMAVGAAAVAPQGFVQFCTRQPVDCGASALELAELRGQSGGGSAVAAISYDWSKVFKTAKPLVPAAPATSFDWSKVFKAAQAPQAPAAQPAAAPFDWSKVFAEARAAESAAVPAVAREAAPSAFAAEPEVVALTKRSWRLIARTNDAVNRAIVERNDQEIYGVSEYWALPLETGLKVGDCEDYALEKRRALIAAGVPAHALSIAVVVTPQAQEHAVLLVATDRGEYVLDNLTPWVLPWTKTPYQWRERQVAGSASHWAMAAVAPPAPTRSLLLASLR